MTGRMDDDSSNPPPTNPPADFEYIFPAIRGVQAQREYYVLMCPLRLIPRLFLFNEDELPPELRAQRPLNRARVPEIAQYIVNNPDSYIFSALTASVDMAVHFEPVSKETEPKSRIGTLAVPMTATFVINDGQHRRAAIQQALCENPALGDETIAIVLFIDAGLNTSQQMFADLNRYAVRPSKSIGLLYDHRDPQAQITRLVVSQTPLLRDLTEMETNNLAPRSRKLFTLSAVHSATTALLEDVGSLTLAERVDIAVRHWESIASQFPAWHQVMRGEVTAGEIRRDFIHTHSIILHALGKIGRAIITENLPVELYEERISKLKDIDWHRTNLSAWEGRATNGGRVSKSRTHLLLTTAYIRRFLGMPIPPEEAKSDEAFTRGVAK